MLLAPEALELRDDNTADAWICHDCYRHLERGQLPRLALANRMWIGDIPTILSILTLPEQLLVALRYPRVYSCKLYPKKGGHFSPETLQSGMRGNVSSYEMNIPEIASMLEGKLMPRPTCILASVIAIAFIGRGPLPKNWLKSTFRVRRDVVSEALLWLKAHNPLYAALDISDEALARLPVDDIPLELEAVIRQEEDPSLRMRESDTYLPTEVDDREDGDFSKHLRSKSHLRLTIT